MKLLRLAAMAVAMTIAGWSLPAAAQMVSAANPSSVVSALQRAGYKAELSKDDSGDPMIRSSSGGTDFIVFFFGCTENAKCATLQFYAGYTDRSVTLSQINDWNSKMRFARGYLADTGAARVEMDVDLDDGGMSALLFEDNLQFWVTLMGKFEQHIGQ